MKGPFSVLVHHRAPPAPAVSGPLDLLFWRLVGAARSPKRRRQLESSLPSCLPSLLQSSPGRLRRCHCHIAPVRARFCLVHVVCSVPGYTRLMQCKRNLERTFLSVPTPPHPTAPAGCSCSSTGHWAPAMPRQTPQYPCAHLRILGGFFHISRQSCVQFTRALT